eukprot:Skav216510  [mRNA]  locus=scaffold1123:695497:703130:- [translate_table: standard]
MFTYELAQRLSRENLPVLANVLDPGVVDTELQRYLSTPVLSPRDVHAPAAVMKFAKSPKQGAETSVQLALNDLSTSYDPKVWEALWKRSAELGEELGEGAAGARFQAMARLFDETFAEHQELVDNASALVSLYGDEATTPQRFTVQRSMCHSQVECPGDAMALHLREDTHLVLPFYLAVSRRMQDLEDRTEQLREKEDRENSPFRRNSRPRAYRPTSLNREWYDAVFDKVLSITGEEGTSNSPLERFFADEGLPASQAVCFACTDAGAKALQGSWGMLGHAGACWMLGAGRIPF